MNAGRQLRIKEGYNQVTLLSTQLILLLLLFLLYSLPLDPSFLLYSSFIQNLLPKTRFATFVKGARSDGNVCLLSLDGFEWKEAAPRRRTNKIQRKRKRERGGERECVREKERRTKSRGRGEGKGRARDGRHAETRRKSPEVLDVGSGVCVKGFR